MPTLQFKKYFRKFSESYVDTLSKLYHYSTDVYSENWQSKVLGTDKGYRFKDFKKVCDGISRLMCCYGVGTGDRVAILAQNMPNWAIAFFSATAFGRVAVPILPDSSEAEVTNILHHSESKALFISKKYLSKVSPECLDSLSVVIDIEDLLTIKRDDSSFVCDGRVSEPTADQLAAIIYTSGTTGTPKGVMLSHRNLCHNVFAAFHCWKTTEKDRWLSILPMAHTYEMSLGMLYPFFVGATVTYLDRPVAVSILMKAMAEVKPTTMLSVPLIIEKVVKKSIIPTIEKSVFLSWMQKNTPKILYLVVGKKLKKTFGGHLRFFGVGGAKLDPEVEDWLFKLKFPYAVGYGMTECAPLICTANPYDVNGKGTTGKAAYGAMVKLIDVNPETGEGELVVRGDQVMLGYYKDPQHTREMFTSDGYMHTGDLASIDKVGKYYIRGRIKNMIIGPSGENIYPEEIERIINDMDVVDESLVVDRDGKLVALVHLDENALRYSLKDEAELIEKYEAIKQRVLERVNKVVGKSSKISDVEVVKEPFVKTATMKIRRFLYRKSNNPKK